MSITARSELKELFFQEVESYIPEIRKKLAVLETNRSDFSAIQELHRLFHNIRGASSQVQLMLLSGSAKKVEALFSDLLETESPLTGNILETVEEIAGLIDGYIAGRGIDAEDEKNLLAQVTDLFAKNGLVTDGNTTGSIGMIGQDEQREWLHSVRSILPLLQELGECLSSDEQDEDYNRLVYGKIAHAVSILAACTGTGGMSQQYQLMQDFYLLVERLASEAVPHHLEMPELVQDFLQFLEVVFSHPDPENNTITLRIKKHLQIFHVLLSHPQTLKDNRERRDIDSVIGVDLFDEPIKEDESVAFLDQLADTSLGEEFFDDQDEEAEGIKDEIDEEQQILMEIFHSECDEHLIVINQSLNILENQVKETQPLAPELRETVNVMRRAIHTLKGAAAMTGVDLLAQGAHKLEDMLDWLYDESEDISTDDVQVLAAGIDVIELLSQTPNAKESEHLERLVATIHAYLDARSGNVIQSDLDIDETGESVDSGQERVDDIETEVSVTVLEDDVDDGDLDLPGLSGTLRIKLEDLDELVSIEGELVVARGVMEKVVDEFTETLTELDTVKENLRRKSQELEAGFEGQSLYGFNPASSADGDTLTNGELAEFDPIELDRYSQLNLIIRSLNEISVDVNAISATMTSLAGEIRGQVTKQQLTMRLMQDKLMRIRMTPMSSISRMLFRTVREAGRKLEKQVTLTVTGEDVYMDRFVWAKITDPLMHVLRNAVDHGIESAEIRSAHGKPAVGVIHLEAEQRSRYVVLRVSDDGGGVQLATIREKLKVQRLAKDPDSLTDDALIEHLFHPSFSTKQDISTISGRGVGLDVVKKNVQDLRGSVEVINTPGRGVTFEFHIPFTLSVNRAVIISVAGKQFAVPLQDIHHVGHFAQEEIVAEDGFSIFYGGDSVAVTNLGYYLQLEDKTDGVSVGQDGMLVILFNKGDVVVGVAVDSVVEQREIIVKNLGTHLIHVPGIGGVTVTGTGALIPILNLRELVEAERPGQSDEFVIAPEMVLGEPLKVLIVDDSISVRHSVARMIESQSWKQQQAVDGLDALAKLEVFVPDVIVLDIEMPRMNGYEFKSNINNHPLWKDIPIIMLTSRASEKHQQKARELGIDLYMTKPYEDTAFVRMLEGIRTS